MKFKLSIILVFSMLLILSPVQAQEQLELLLNQRHPSIVPELIKHLPHVSAQKQKKILAALSHYKELKIAKDIAYIFKSSESEVRWEALHTCIQLRDPSCTPFFESLLNDPDMYVQIRALNGIKELGNQSHFQLVLPLLKTPHKLVKLHAVQTLIKIGDIEGLDSLLYLLKDPEKQTVQSLIDLLHFIQKSKRTELSLLVFKLWNFPDTQIQQEVLHTLSILLPQKLPDFLNRQLLTFSSKEKGQFLERVLHSLFAKETNEQEALTLLKILVSGAFNDSISVHNYYSKCRQIKTEIQLAIQNGFTSLVPKSYVKHSCSKMSSELYEWAMERAKKQFDLLLEAHLYLARGQQKKNITQLQKAEKLFGKIGDSYWQSFAIYRQIKIFEYDGQTTFEEYKPLVKKLLKIGELKLIELAIGNYRYSNKQLVQMIPTQTLLRLIDPLNRDPTWDVLSHLSKRELTQVEARQLLPLLDSPKRTVRQRTIWLLSKKHFDLMIPFLPGLSKDSNGYVLSNLVEALSHDISPIKLKYLTQLSQSPGPAKLSALSVLEKNGQDVLPQVLATVQNSSNQEATGRYLKLLSKLMADDPSQLKKILVSLLKSTKKYTRQEASYELYRIKDKKGLDTLIESEYQRGDRNEKILILNALRDSSFIPLPASFLKELNLDDSELKLGVLNAIKRKNLKQSTIHLRPLLNDRNTEVKDLAFILLQKNGHNFSFEELRAFTKSYHSNTVITAVNALLKMNKKLSEWELLTLLQNSDSRVVNATLGYIDYLNDRRYIPYVLPLLDSNHVSIRMNALDIILSKEPIRLFPYWLDMIGTRNAKLNKRIVHILNKNASRTILMSLLNKFEKDNHNSRVHTHILEILIDFTGKVEYTPLMNLLEVKDLDSFLNSPNENIQEDGLLLLDFMKDKQVVLKRLKQFLVESNHQKLKLKAKKSINSLLQSH